MLFGVNTDMMLVTLWVHYGMAWQFGAYYLIFLFRKRPHLPLKWL